MRRVLSAAGLAALLGTLAVAAGDGEPPSTTTQPAGAPNKPASNLDYWLSRAKPAQTQPSTSQAGEMPQAGRNPFRTEGNFSRADAVPGVVQLSNNKLLPGGIYTTRDKDLLVWVEDEKRWRRVPLLTVLSITAVVVENKMEQVWRWKEMGVPERVYTGEEYPSRRLLWKVHLIDDSTITGAIKGQPISVENGQATSGPFVLHERVRGKVGQSLSDLVTVKKIIVSRRLMEEASADAKGRQKPASSAPAGS
ncbi:MAG TPA: hypothetical protein VNA25_16075 [Phycisphaerae bacterium]|nr:hypothetical protein [Phycisphaerae bacterium]